MKHGSKIFLQDGSPFWNFLTLSSDFRKIAKLPPDDVFFNVNLISKQFKTNEQIRARQVRLIDEQDQQVGVVNLEEAISMAKERGFDLVEVAPNIQPPVCKIMDYGKYQYRQSKIEKKHRKLQQKHELKGIRMSIRTSGHDLAIKVKKAEKFLKDGNSVKVVIIFKGRERAHKDMAMDKMQQFAEQLVGTAKMEGEPTSQGFSMTMILHPQT